MAGVALKASLGERLRRTVERYGESSRPWARLYRQGWTTTPLPRLLEEPGVTGPQAKPDLVPGVPEPYPGAARSWLRREGRDKGIQLPAIVARGMDPAEGFCHCGDGLDPMMMEGKDKPVDFQRVFDHVRAISPYPEEDPTDEDTIISSAQELLDGLEGPSKEFKKVNNT